MALRVRVSWGKRDLGWTRIRDRGADERVDVCVGDDVEYVDRLVERADEQGRRDARGEFWGGVADVGEGGALAAGAGCVLNGPGSGKYQAVTSVLQRHGVD